LSSSPDWGAADSTCGNLLLGLAHSRSSSWQALLEFGIGGVSRLDQVIGLHGQAKLLRLFRPGLAELVRSPRGLHTARIILFHWPTFWAWTEPCPGQTHGARKSYHWNCSAGACRTALPPCGCSRWRPGERCGGSCRAVPSCRVLDLDRVVQLAAAVFTNGTRTCRRGSPAGTVPAGTSAGLTGLAIDARVQSAEPRIGQRRY